MNRATLFQLVRKHCAVLVLGGALLSPLGCAGEYYDEGGTVEIAAEPPPPRYEVVPPVPYAGAVWVGGRWIWRGGRHVWYGGRYVRPRPGYVYAPHAWVHVGNRWRYRPGGWRR